MKAIKWTARSLAGLLVVIGVAMIVAAAVVVVWQQTQKVTVTPKAVVAKDPEITDINLIQGASQVYKITVTNPGDTEIIVTLTTKVTGSGTGVTATITEPAMQTIAAGAHFDYTVTVTAAADATGTATIDYELTQT